MRPYTQSRIEGGKIIREFSGDLNQEDLEWHMDRRDRYVRVLEGEGWKLQLENGLPFELASNSTHFVPKESWHRLIKGNGPLRISIREVSEREMRGRAFEIVTSNDVRVRQVWTKLGADVALMEAQGRTPEERDEYVFEQLARMERRALREADEGGFDLFRGVKKMAADKVADLMGIQSGFLRDLLTNFVAGLGIADLKNMFSPGSCKLVVTKLAGAFQGAIIDKIAQSMGLAPTNFIMIAITEAIKSGFVESGPFVRIASEKICNFKFSDLLPGGGLTSMFGGGSEAAPAAGSAAAAPSSALPPGA